MIIIKVDWEITPDILRRRLWFVNLLQWKCNSSLSELKWYLTVGPHWFATHCSIPSCTFQMGKNMLACLPKRYAESMTINYGGIKRLRNVCQILLLSVTTNLQSTLKTVNCMLCKLCDRDIMQSSPMHPFLLLTDKSRDHSLPAKMTTRICNLAWGQWTEHYIDFCTWGK